jgi:hypothetical protein
VEALPRPTLRLRRGPEGAAAGQPGAAALVGVCRGLGDGLRAQTMRRREERSSIRERRRPSRHDTHEQVWGLTPTRLNSRS